MVLTALDYEQIALSEPGRKWELHRGQLREKPPMSIGHDRALAHLDHLLQRQLPWEEYQVEVNAGRLRRTTENYYIPDLFVVPQSLMTGWRERVRQLNVFTDPLPLVVEIWSPSTGDYDIDEKLPEYMLRGDLEIWRIHPFDRTLTIWRRQSDGSYVETLMRGGVVQPVSLPGVSIDLDQLFA
jgi:Uma2 family endonuclease